MGAARHRFLTTHVGSLPRSQAVVDLIFAREREEPIDEAAFDAVMAQAVNEVVRRQVASGIDIVSDGEMSKISYATYIKDRFTGFDGDSPRRTPAATWRRTTSSTAWAMVASKWLSSTASPRSRPNNKSTTA